MSQTFLFLIILILIILIFGTAAWAGILAAPWLPTRKKDIKRILELANLKPGELVYDLGSGDGRILIEAARAYKIQGRGIEISFLPYLWSKMRVWLGGFSNQIQINYGNFFQKDLSQADVVFCFLTPRAMKKLEEKFKKELKLGCRVVSSTFSLANWKPLKIDKPNQHSLSLYLYWVD